MHQLSHKLYILVDKTLSRSQQAVQACHAMANFALKYGNDWKHQSIILLAMQDQGNIDDWYFDLKMNHKDLKVAEFFEPYWDDRLTAIAVHGCDDLVKDLELL